MRANAAAVTAERGEERGRDTEERGEMFALAMTRVEAAGDAAQAD